MFPVMLGASFRYDITRANNTASIAKKKYDFMPMQFFFFLFFCILFSLFLLLLDYFSFFSFKRCLLLFPCERPWEKLHELIYAHSFNRLLCPQFTVRPLRCFRLPNI